MKDKNKTTPTAIKITGKAKGNMFVGCDVGGAVKIEKEAKDNKFIDTNINVLPRAYKKWYERPSGIIALGALASLLAWLLLHYFGYA